MKSLKIFLLFLSAGIHFCKAQDTALLLSPKMFEERIPAVLISKMDGWFFRLGNDTGWAKKDLDLTGWKRLKPTELSGAFADKSGRVECWFRIKIKLDTTFTNKLGGFNSRSWGATDAYIDGNLITSSGNTGQNGMPFRASLSSSPNPVPVNLRSGKEYTIALHFVDYVAPLPPLRLKTEDTGLQFLAVLTTPDFKLTVSKLLNQLHIYETIWIVVCTILSLLFWLLSLQNGNEKNFRLIALCSTFFSLSLWCDAGGNFINISYSEWVAYNYAGDLFTGIIFIVIPLILVNIFKRRVTGFLKWLLIVLFAVLMGKTFLPGGRGNILLAASTISVMGISIYYIASSWKRLKGAQWAIVVGLLLSLLSILLLLFKILSHGQNIPDFYLYITGFVLSFPLALLVYVAMRFKEIIKEVQQNAQQVVQLSEDKKEQALNQKKLLEEEVHRQTIEIRTTLENLKSTQAQLIQSEKMASLGDLTAGIAHEIQNPLNFVNNFSDVNKELLVEMKTEMDNGNTDEAKSIANNVIANEEKINHHGKRADAIVKGMLQHSRPSSGVMQATNLNDLAVEYFRLSYHGIKAKDKEFNSEMKTDFDKSIGKINIIPQDIGRVLFNLYNNAFYAVNEKKSLIAAGYEPVVSVSTKKISNKVEISVKDDGTGIPQKVLDKIFQPFFTTKPTGQGTGLGLSLSYDIIKAHGGEIKVTTKEGSGSEFIVNTRVEPSWF